METGVSGLPASGADSACVPASGSHACPRDWLSGLKPVVAENKRLDKLDTEKGKKETNGFRIGTRLVRKDASGNNVFGMVVQVVSKSDEANEYEYPWVWAAWMDGELTAPGNDKTELHNMRKNFNQPWIKASAPDFPRKLFIEKWYAHFRHGIRALVQPGAHSSILGLRVPLVASPNLTARDTSCCTTRWTDHPASIGSPSIVRATYVSCTIRSVACRLHSGNRGSVASRPRIQTPSSHR
jgi:hypothetical protein